MNKHYKSSGIEPIDAIEAWGLGFRLGNVIKYVARADKKGQQIQDLKKALWYLERELAKVSSGATDSACMPTTDHPKVCNDAYQKVCF